MSFSFSVNKNEIYDMFESLKCSQRQHVFLRDAPTTSGRIAARMLGTLNAGYLCGRLTRSACRAQKEVIQPHLPIRLPCYDFTPVIGHTVASALLAVKLPASGATNSHGVTGGVYKARERIHRSNADLRLLAIPTSWSRVADSNPD